MNSIDLTLYVVTDREILGEKDLIKSIEQAILGGATVVQLREKNISTKDFHKIAIEAKKVTSKYKVPLIINDRIDIVLSSEADGLHIGQDDMPLEIARTILGEEKIIGVSVRSVSEAIVAEKRGADYLGVGAVFPTESKSDATLVGLTELKRIKDKVNIPVVAIGGINETNTKEVMEHKADGVAVISAVFSKEDITDASKALLKIIRG